jgi:hypothetical protein
MKKLNPFQVVTASSLTAGAMLAALIQTLIRKEIISDEEGMNNRGESVTRNRMSMSCRRGSSRPRRAHCFENTAFRQLNSLFPSSLRCGSRRSIVACFRSRASCTCLWTFAQRLGRQ